MSEQIAVGDLVMVVRGHECALGKPFTVWGFHHPKVMGMWTCSACKESGLSYEVFAADNADSAMPLSWLKRIPPLTEPESVEHGEGVTA